MMCTMIKGEKIRNFKGMGKYLNGTTLINKMILAVEKMN